MKFFIQRKIQCKEVAIIFDQETCWTLCYFKSNVSRNLQTECNLKDCDNECY